MNVERAEEDGHQPTVLEQLQHSALMLALNAMLDQLRRRLPPADTSIAWEDGEPDSERETGR